MDVNTKQRRKRKAGVRVPIQHLDPEFAWAIGLFEGEGHFVAWRGTSGQRRVYLRMGLDMTDHDVVRRFADVVGVGSLSGPYLGKGGRKPKLRWSATGAVARELVQRTGFIDNLGDRRRDRVLEILAEVDAQPPLLARKAHFTHCKHGHEFNDENTYHTKNGHRQCRPCQRRRYREWVARHA